MKTRIISLLAVLFIALATTGCATGNLRKADEIATVKRGVVTDLKEVTLAGNATGIGSSAGSAIGTAFGANAAARSVNTGGDFKRAVIGALFGSIVGAVAGNELEKKVTEASGVEITIKLDDGAEVAVPQRREAAEGIKIGDHVRVVQTGAKAIVEKAS